MHITWYLMCCLYSSVEEQFLGRIRSFAFTFQTYPTSKVILFILPRQSCGLRVSDQISANNWTELSSSHLSSFFSSSARDIASLFFCCFQVWSLVGVIFTTEVSGTVTPFQTIHFHHCYGTFLKQPKTYYGLGSTDLISSERWIRDVTFIDSLYLHQRAFCVLFLIFTSI